ncbi:large-conductance mechanosensitive channel [Virgibacillus natechei]|uniref:Large-conductance mechanosensitive channel n=2 Tax=Virgibacillus natechei TaxID=1216297 RepID=A0ABS4IJ23_9BACI|nr:DUF4083 family protein [Virgibacillus natechei]MBP1970920.1 large-conductance mechanosensitive channel [Virgibacillus natechei]UZD13302.1 DUF4083 family protein [Virgibacillus natechei]
MEYVVLIYVIIGPFNGIKQGGVFMFMWGDFIVQLVFLIILVVIVALVVLVIRKFSKRSKQLDRIEKKLDDIAANKDG